eukprot:9324088-Heterocapsa_arctica.AAC.1
MLAVKHGNVMEELGRPLLPEVVKFGAKVPPALVNGPDGFELMAKDATQAFRIFEQLLTISINLVVA